jgi:archaetidylinositol phosphate synthase
MVLNKYRSSADRILNPIVTLFSGLNPNTLSAASVLFAFLAGIALAKADAATIESLFKPGHFAYIMLAIASICVFLNGFLDAVDGKVARLTNRTSKRGDFLDHALDRYADILILGGIMLSPYCDTLIGALAIIAVLLTSYMGTQAQALGCGRDYSGILGRADRMVILIITPLIQMWVLYYFVDGRIPVQFLNNYTILEWVMLWFILAGNVTAIHRGIQSWRELKEQESGQSDMNVKVMRNKHMRPSLNAGTGTNKKRTLRFKPVAIKKMNRKKSEKKSKKENIREGSGFDIEWESKPVDRSMRKKGQIKVKKRKMAKKGKKR